MNVRFSGIFAWAAASAFHQGARAEFVTYEFISCEYQSSGSWAGCSVIPHEYLPFRGYERSVTFKYTFNCSPGEASKFAIGAKTRILGIDQWIQFDFGKSGSSSFDTRSSVSIGNNTAKRFYDANLNPGCSLVVETSESGPTLKQLDVWKDDASRHDNVISAEKILQAQLKNLSNLNAAFDILSSLVSNLDASLRQQAELINRIKSGDVTKSLLEIAENTPDAGRALVLRTLVKEIERIRTDDSSDDVLSKSLSPDDLALIRGISRPQADEIRTSLENSVSREEKAFSDIWVTCLEGRKFIEIPSCDARYPGVDWRANL